ncbi:DUF4231 domain-containing protein [Mucilaginibacter terrigena]|uniref:DUF4231 domain-containing protein n=1 Tax=Mucilaginibacter terrigena TaxID=2492395 RepID=A0A4Q5LQH4_9SPHI|nr:DUF4231 domain-containing protein [Mucilaginibacter terrigena]RYU91637.1 DUF4231 domain-containing protein [Mucilaginibacter terrigena]
MDKILFDKYVQERYIKQMEYYSNSSAKNQSKYNKFQWVLIILSALTPVFAALGGFKTKIISGNEDILNLLVIIVSVIVAILTTGLKTFNYQELWASYRSTYELLKPEIHYYNFNVGPYGAAGVDKESLFVTRVEGILNSEHVNWPAAKKQADKNDKPKDNGEENPPEKAPPTRQEAGQPAINLAPPQTDEEKPGNDEILPDKV